MNAKGLGAAVVLEWAIANWQVLFVVGLTIVALIFFVREILPIEVTALGVLVMLAASGVISIPDAFSGFSNDATITVLMMFILSAAVLQSGLIDWLGDRMGVLMGRSIFRQIIVIGILIAPISAFINNTAAVAVFIPLVVRLANEAGRSPSKLLIPISYAAMLGGMITLIGTSTNLLGNSIRQSEGLGTFGMFEFAAAGAMITVVGIVYMSTIGHRLIPARVEARQLDDRYHLREFIFEVELPEKSVLIGEIAGGSDLANKFEAEVLQVHRGDQVLEPARTPIYYAVGDRLLIRARRTNLQRMADTGIVSLVPAGGDEDAVIEHLTFAELLVHQDSLARGKRLGFLDFWSRHRIHPVALHSRGRTHATQLRERHLRSGDVVLVCGAEDDIQNLTGEDQFRVQGGPETPIRRPHKTPLVIGTLAAVVGLAALDVFPIVLTATAGVVFMVATGALRIQEMYGSIHWNVIFLLAGLIPLGIAMQQSGAAALLAGLLAGAAQWMPPLALLGLFYLLTTSLTNVISNNAAVVLTAPVGIETAMLLGYNPLAFLLASMFAASTSFLTPVGYQTNLMVMTPGGYRYADFFRVGAPLNLLMAVVTPFILNYFWPIV